MDSMSSELHMTGNCCHEDEIQTHSRKIEALEVRADYKEKMIDSLNEKMEKMDKKLDDIVDTVNQIKLESNNDDTNLELRLTKIETEQMLQKDLTTRRLTLLGLGLTVLTIVLNVVFNIMK